MKPRVVILSAFLTPFRSGAEACAEEVALALQEQFDITIVTARLRSSLPRSSFLGKQGQPATSQPANQQRVRVIRVGFGSSIDKWFYPFLAPFAVRKLKPDIIHAVLESYAGFAMMLCRWLIPTVKRILTCQSTNTKMFLEGMHRAADVVTCISSVLIARAHELGKMDAVLIPNGIHYAQIRKACEGITKAKGRILFVGRLEPMKGVDTLIDAFVQVHAEATKATLHIVGDGSLRKELEALVTSLGLQQYVTFKGYVAAPDLFTEYAEAEIFCGLSRSEALGNVFLEAQAAECAVLATNIGGIPDIVTAERTGVLVAPNDHHAAAAKLLLLLREGAYRHQLAVAGRESASKYDWQGIAGRYAEVYRKMIGG